MKTIIITSIVGKKIRPIQEWLFNKYAKRLKPHWIDLEGRHIEKWCANVAKGIRELHTDGITLFLLDDHLLFDYVLPSIPKVPPNGLDRLELGKVWSHQKDAYDMGDYLEYKKSTLYSVSTQPSLWRTKSLLKVLDDVDSNPWVFETKGRCKASVVKKPAMRFIAESAISKRRPGKVNINGMKESDKNELIELGLLNEKDIVYNWK